MLNKFIERILEQFPELPENRTLLAVSGGIDSMTMTHLFETVGWDYGIAHCNFQLRGKDSDDDHDFIKSVALHSGKTFHSITFETEQEAKERGISIQMVARELRYPWLEAVRQEHTYDFVATAHHLNDSIETSLINQTRGTGLRGLSGIPARQGKLIRPMLAFTRSEIKDYLDQHKVAYREDSSNAKVEYHRNRIRHQVIPVLKGINPTFERTFEKNLKIWSASTWLVDWACTTLAEQYVQKTDEQWEIDYDFIKDHPEAAPTLFFEWVKELGFHPDQLEQALQVAGKSIGAIWYSASYRLLADRTAFLIREKPAEEKTAPAFTMGSAGTTLVLGNARLQSELYERPESMKFSPSEDTVELDAGKVKFPLRIRHWQEGDVFCPLGMHGRQKKLQDFFSDLKLNRFEKEQIWLVINADGNIVWVVGHRLDDRFKVDGATQKILKLEFLIE